MNLEKDIKRIKKFIYTLTILSILIFGLVVLFGVSILWRLSELHGIY